MTGSVQGASTTLARQVPVATLPAESAKVQPAAPFSNDPLVTRSTVWVAAKRLPAPIRQPNAKSARAQYRQMLFNTEVTSRVNEGQDHAARVSMKNATNKFYV